MRSARNFTIAALCISMLPTWGCYRPKIESEELARLYAGLGDERMNYKSVLVPFSSDTHIALRLDDSNWIVSLREGERLSPARASEVAREIRDRMDGLVLGVHDRSAAGGASAKWEGFPQVDPAVEFPETWREGYAFGWWLCELQLRSPSD